MASVNKRVSVSMTPETFRIVSAIKDRNPNLSSSEAVNEAIRLGGLKLEISELNENADKLDLISEQLEQLGNKSNVGGDLSAIAQTIQHIYKLAYQTFALHSRFVKTYDQDNSSSAYNKFEEDLRVHRERTNGRQS